MVCAIAKPPNQRQGLYTPLPVLEFKFHLDLQVDSSNNVCKKRMDNEDTNYTKQTTQQIDKYCSGIYSIIHNNNIRCYSSLHRK